ncbi:PTS fructose transporter subunit IIC [Paenibacillus sp. Root52]|uniref:PTS fructose transporter subunit IIC n=1 Tax=Paenibacillus sp. Root52 TaxID=1736552 RepID=UPI0007005C05|nr:PTS fructose transporter subunit IIC [Paenibacillus sp. Root52]KQY84036.1 PTS fructose transporter subunit IIC [Paenibacillus sp. Root52]
MRKWFGEAKTHLMTGISYLLPVIIAGSLVVAICKIIALSMGITDLDPYKDGSGFLHILYLVQNVGWSGIGLLTIVLSGYIAYSIADKPALAAGLIGGVLAQQTNAGFLGALISGFFAGYITLWVKNKVKITGPAAGSVPLIILPLITVGLTGFLMAVVLGGPLGALNDYLITWVQNMSQSGTNTVLLVIILGAMIGFDLGGPVNKAAWMAGNALFLSGVYLPNVFINIAICIPPLGYGLATLLMKKRFSKTYQEAGKGAVIMGVIGITEGAIPFTLRNPAKMILVNMVACASGAALTALLGAHIIMPPIGGLYGAISVGTPLAYLAGGIFGALIVAGGTMLVNFRDEEEKQPAETKEASVKKNGEEIELVFD